MDTIPLLLLRKYSSVFPHAFRQLARMREARGKDLPWWPDWCYVPMGAVMAVMQSALDDGEDFFAVCKQYPPQVLAALAAWRVTKGIYHFDPDLARELAFMPIEGALPAEIFLTLPEWCIFVEIDPEILPEIKGFFAYLEYVPETAQQELKLVILKPDLEIVLIILHLNNWTLKEAIDSILKDGQEKHQAIFGTPLHIPENYLEDIMPILQPCLNFVLYICSANADYQKRPTHPSRKPAKKGKIETASEIQYWDLGVRLGPALRYARQNEYARTGEGSGTHASPRPHYRRAHWHHFWTGPRNDPERRKLILKWLPPIPVNMPEFDDSGMSVVIHPVRK